MARWRVIVAALWSAGWVGCGAPSTQPPPKKNPPQVFLTASQTQVVGTSFSVSATVSGCEQVSAFELREHDTRLKTAAYAGNPTSIQVHSSELGARYAALGIAPELILTAVATCNDGRSNTSEAVGLRFFPVDLVLDVPGQQLLPDSFYAEGGSAGTPTTFVGCIGTSVGTALARVDQQGKVIAYNDQLPFPCSYHSLFTDRNVATGKRWMWERGVGAMAFDASLNVTSFILGSFHALSVGPDGDAVIWDDKARPDALKRVSHVGTAPNNIKWGFNPAGILMADPRMEPQNGTLAMAVFVDDLGAYQGTVAVERLNYDSGAKVGQNNLKLIHYGLLNRPQIPPAAFDDTGTILYFPHQSSAEVNTPAASVLACASTVDGCTSAALRWQGPLLDGLVLALVPFAQNSQLAVVTEKRLYFQETNSGQVSNPKGTPIAPTGSLVVHGVQPGPKTDFYLLNGPVGGYPVEVVAVDSPSAGELVRFQMNGGQLPTSGLTLAIDDAGALWMRVGLKMVRAMSLEQYRAARGPTP